MISAHVWNKIYHLTLIAVPHYRVECEQVQFFCENSHWTWIALSDCRLASTCRRIHRLN